MRITGAVIVLVLLLIGTGASEEEMKGLPGCVPAPGAVPIGGTGAAATDGYANRVIHQKTGLELALCPPLAGRNTVTVGGVKVTLAKPYYMGRTEITNGQYKRFLNEANYDGGPDVDPAYDTYLAHFRGISIMPTENDCPVVFVSWHNAMEFCKWAGLDLPTEAEWEYACRAGTTGSYSFGSEPADYPKYGWATSNGGGTTHKVAQLKPNSWGHYDMHGNVYEWCRDDYGGPVPADGSPHLNDKLLTKAVRGGAFTAAIHSQAGMAGTRFSSAPGNTHNDLGFRVVLRLQ